MFRAIRTLIELGLFAGMLGACTGWDSAAPAAETDVVFDLPTSVACRDVTPEGFAQANPDRRVFEARLEISTRIVGDGASIEEMTFEFASPEQRWVVYDYFPRTLLEDEFAEPICVTKTHENARSRGASLGVAVPCPIGAVTPGVNGQSGNKDVVTETAKRIAPKKTVLVSGTLDEGHGVFFEWKPSAQHPWVGTRIHVIRFVAPANWQADWGQLICRTKLADHGMFRKSHDSRQANRTIALYRQGSRQGTMAAEQLSTAQSKYLRAIDPQQGRSTKTILGIRWKRGGSDEPTAEDWREQMLDAQKALGELSGSRETVMLSRRP